MLYNKQSGNVEVLDQILSMGVPADLMNNDGLTTLFWVWYTYTQEQQLLGLYKILNIINHSYYCKRKPLIKLR